MKRILFVDDEPNVLEALERMLFPMRKEWHTAFANGGEKALELMKDNSFDVLVTDLRMPGMDGVTLLTKVSESYPETIRFVLSGQPDKETVFRAFGPAHQFMSKPCDAKVLKANVERAFALRGLLANDTLKGIVSQAGDLPALPKTYSALMEELHCKDASLGAVGRIIESDVGMTAKVLQLVNSAFFGLRQRVTSAAQAVSLLGLDTVKALVLVVGVFSQADAKHLPREFSLDALLRHSMDVGSHARAIAQREKADKVLVNDAYTAGVLHDAGTLLLMMNLTEDYAHILDHAFVNGVPLLQSELENLGCTHAEVGAYLLGIWGLSDPLVEAAAFHHCPANCPAHGFSPLTAVHAANVFERETHGTDGDWPPPELDMDYLEKLGLNQRIGDWRTACLSAGQKEG